jgi:hypothetical protein
MYLAGQGKFALLIQDNWLVSEPFVMDRRFGTSFHVFIDDSSSFMVLFAR